MYGKWVFRTIPDGHAVDTAGEPDRWDVDVTRPWEISPLSHHPADTSVSTWPFAFLVREKLMQYATKIRTPGGHRIKGFQGRAEVTQSDGYVTVRAGGTFRTANPGRHNGDQVIAAMLDLERHRHHWTNWCSRYGCVF